MQKLNAQISTVLKPFLHKACWHVSVGGCTLPTFSLALGEKFKRARPLKNPAQPSVFRKYEPEISMFVWCAWRLDCGNSIIASDDASAGEITHGLKQIIGKSATSIRPTSPAWDLVIDFEKNLRLTVFCNHTGKKPSFKGNWQAKVGQAKVFAGPGSKLEIVEKLKVK